MMYNVEIDDNGRYSVVTLPGDYSVWHWESVLRDRAEDGHTVPLTLEPVVRSADSVTYIFHRPDDIAELVAIQAALDLGADAEQL